MRFQRSLTAAALAALVIVALAATALAAKPKKGAHFKGVLLQLKTGTFVGPVKIGNFHAPVSFRVSSSGKKMLAFTYGYVGCFGFGGIGNRNPFTLPGGFKRFGPMSVSASGRFSAPETKSTHTSSGRSGNTRFTSVLTTTSSVSGRFTSSTRATGTITFTQTDKLNSHKPSSCGPVSLTFSATA